jgi:hypothetical protein
MVRRVTGFTTFRLPVFPANISWPIIETVSFDNKVYVR